MILHYQPIRDPSDLCIWEPREGHAIVACKVDAGRGVWEPRTYEFRKCASGGWLIQVGDSGPPYGRGSWAEVVHWLCLMRPIEIELVTTV